jgi:hypothetical protein
MQLTEFSFRGDSWELKNLEFGEASLIVGKNATGKSRTLKQLTNFFRMIRQAPQLLPEGEFSARFSKNEQEEYTYSIVISGDNPHTLSITEEFKINNEVVLNRRPVGDARILNRITNSFETISPPSNKLSIHVNRDTKKYPFFEDIAIWAEHAFNFKFGSILPGLANINLEIDFWVLNSITSLYSELNDEAKERVLLDLMEIGYFLEQVNTKEGSHFDILQIKERGIDALILEEDISQGMLRSIYVIIFLSYMTSVDLANTILIDDLCEGLDYERATKLGKLVFQRCKEHGIQLIATSNDMFLMDVVDIKYWNVLQRKNNLITSLNAKNNAALFENFKYTGLSNFDFFASDYIPQKLDR